MPDQTDTQAPIIAGFTYADVLDIAHILRGIVNRNGSLRTPGSDIATLADALEIIEAIAADRG